MHCKQHIAELKKKLDDASSVNCNNNNVIKKKVKSNSASQVRFPISDIFHFTKITFMIAICVI